MTTIGLIRHGRTEWNTLGRLQGQMDTDLTDEGREQAKRLCIRLRQEEWNCIISSDLSRARETAEIISLHSGIPFQAVDSRLRERCFGQAEGLTLEERMERFGPDWKTRVPDMETDEDVWSRWMDFAGDLSAAYTSDHKVLLVSHGSFIVQVLRGLSLEREELLQNTSLTILQRTPDSWNLVLYNCLAHIEAMSNN